jgi:hypothetical protein
MNDGIYIGLIILVLFGAALALVLYPWQMVVHEDGSRDLVEQHLAFYRELASSWHAFKNNLWILFFKWWCWAINYYTVYQNNNFNGEVFTVRARALNVLCSSLVQILALWTMQ